MSFNPDRAKQAQEIIFFNNSKMKLSSIQKHLELILDSKLLLNEQINDNIHQTNKGVSILRKLQKILPRNSLLTFYKSLTRPLLDYADMIYDQTSNESFSK